jgi:hypothetical protein
MVGAISRDRQSCQSLFRLTKNPEGQNVAFEY